MQDDHVFRDRETVAERWYDDEYTPVVGMLRQAALIGTRTEAQAYLWVACEPYRLIRTHRWDDGGVEALRRAH